MYNISRVPERVLQTRTGPEIGFKIIKIITWYNRAKQSHLWTYHDQDGNDSIAVWLIKQSKGGLKLKDTQLQISEENKKKHV